MKRRRALHCVAAGALAAVTAESRAAEGLRSARVLLGVPAGAPGDLLARSVVERLRGRYAQAMVVENMPGASTQLAINAAVRSAADGSTILLSPSSPLSLFPSTFSKLSYRPTTDLRPVTLAAHFNHAFAVGPAVPERVVSLQGFVDWARQHPEKANYGTSGVGTIPHLLGVIVSKHSGVPMLNIPYKGSGPAVTDLLGGQISAMSSPIGFFLPYLQTGKLRLLAVSGAERSRLAPAVPTYKEIGIPVIAREWLGFFLPAQASLSVANDAGQALRQALSQDEVAKGVASTGLEVASSTPEELATMLNADATEWLKVIREIGFKADTS